MASLLVIGGSGFFGKSILDAYKRGLLLSWDIERIDIVARRASSLAASNPELVFENVFLHNLDILNCELLPMADYVIYASASSDMRSYLPEALDEVGSVKSSLTNFCQLVRHHFVHSKVLYVSSGAVYGDQFTSLELIKEDVKLQPLSILDQGRLRYAAVKRECEARIIELADAGFSVSIARCFAFVGPYLPRDKNFAIGNFIEDGLKNRSIIVKADTPVYRSYLYSDDLVFWLMNILHRSDASCPIVNVGSDESILIGDLAKIVANYYGVQAVVPDFKNLSVDWYIPNINKALSMGCTVDRDLRQSLMRTIEAIAEHQK